MPNQFMMLKFKKIPYLLWTDSTFLYLWNSKVKQTLNLQPHIFSKIWFWKLFWIRSWYHKVMNMHILPSGTSYCIKWFMNLKKRKKSWIWNHSCSQKSDLEKQVESVHDIEKSCICQICHKICSHISKIPHWNNL